jgi:predicted dehydrogenase
MDTNVKLKAALYGANGHQLTHLLKKPHPLVDIHAICGMAIPEGVVARPNVYPTLAAMLEDGEVDFVSLCSPRRADQVQDALACLRAGKHVLAEKPSAFSEAELDMLLAEAKSAGREFREMGGTVIAHPYWALRKIVLSGEIGEVVQVFAQKSYPYFPERPQDEAVDGGLFLQVGIHAARMIEHGSGLKLRELTRMETGHGNPGEGKLKMASGFQGRLENGGLATAIAN